jgi:glyceraldehyde-3-phosphate dehydrogenase (NAD(P))
VIKVGVFGYGTIGKRVADAVMLQDDMELVGVTVNRYNYKIKSAIEKGINTYALQDSFGVECGRLHDFLSSSDIVVDCTPKGVGNINKLRYQKAGLKAIFQGGESSDVGKSFVAQCNYEESFGEDFVRVVSCNTTGLCRTLHAVDQAFGIKMVHATMIRRAADPWDIHHGPINSIVPTFELPSHHGPDVRTILPHLEVFTTSLSVPTTIMHMHSVTVDLKEEIKAHEAVDLFNSTTRVRVVRNSDGIRSTAEIIEYAKDMGRNRGDMPEICIWEETVGVFGNKLFYLQAVHQESNVIPENIDAIRAMTKLCGKEESISKTNESLGII